jgi:drug/metabolite transporter (DMT)-like permease
MAPGRAFDFAILAAGVLAVSTAAIFIREADAPALVISAYRLTLASLPLLLFSTARHRSLVPRSREQLLLTLSSGAFLALHFGFWVASVKQTSIVTSVVLVTMAPLFVALASGPLLREKPSLGTWIGLAIAAAGTMVMVAEDLGEGAGTVRGDAFALLGALFAAAYLLAGRRILTTGGNWQTYSTGTYSTSAVLLVLAVVVSGHAFTGYESDAYMYFFLLALVPQLIGHTAVNRSLGHLPAIAVALAVQGEPVGATVLAAIFLDEHPTTYELAGGLLVLSGVFLGLRSQGRPREAALRDDFLGSAGTDG